MNQEFIMKVTSGELSIPIVKEHGFYMEIGKIITKAKKDSRFKHIKYPFDVEELGDGMYVADHHLLFIYDNDWIIIHGDEPGFGDSICSTEGLKKVASRYFNVVDDNGELLKYRLMKSYFHIWLQPNLVGPLMLSNSKRITAEKYERLVNLFKVKPYQEISSQDDMEKYMEKVDSGKHYASIHFDGMYSFCVMEDDTTGFHLVLTKWDGDYIYDLSFSNKPKFNFAETFQNTTGEPISNEFRELIAFGLTNRFITHD